MKCTACDNAARNQQNPNTLSVPGLSAALLWEWNTEAGVFWSSQVLRFHDISSGCDERVGINLRTRVKGYRTCMLAAGALLCLQ